MLQPLHGNIVAQTRDTRVGVSKILPDTAILKDNCRIMPQNSDFHFFDGGNNVNNVRQSRTHLHMQEMAENGCLDGRTCHAEENLSQP